MRAPVQADTGSGKRRRGRRPLRHRAGGRPRLGGDGLPREGSQVQPRGRPEGAQARDCRWAPTGVGSSARSGSSPGCAIPTSCRSSTRASLPCAGGRESLFYVMPYVEGESLRDRLERERACRSGTPFGSRARSPMRWRTPTASTSCTATSDRRTFCSRAAMPWSPTSGSPGCWRSRWRGDLELGAGPGPSRVHEPRAGERGRWIDGRSDIYSLGCVLYEMLAGLPPFTGPTRAAVLARAMAEGIPPLRTVCPPYPPRSSRRS